MNVEAPTHRVVTTAGVYLVRFYASDWPELDEEYDTDRGRVRINPAHVIAVEGLRP